MKRKIVLLLLVTAIALSGCTAAIPAETEATQTNTLEVEIMDFSHETEHVIIWPEAASGDWNS